MAAVFTNEAAVRDAAVLNLRIEILGQIFYAVFMVYHALAIGAGHSTFAMLSSFANCIVFRVVLSLLFNHLWGIYGLYAACAVAPSISVPLGWLVHPLGRLAAQFGQNRKVTSRTGPFPGHAGAENGGCFR